MTKQISAKALRKIVPPQDLNDKAFKPENDFGIGLADTARTLDELRTKLGEYGNIAVLSAEWDAIFAWLRRDNPADLCADIAVVREALTLWREKCLYEHELARRNGLYLPLIQLISECSQEEAERVAADTLRRWEAAGRPCLTRTCIGWSHRMFLYRLRAKEHADRRAATGLAA